jgi:hypothetical protein
MKMGVDFKKSGLIFAIILCLSLNAAAVEKLDATMCIKSEEELGALVTGCIKDCQADWDTNQKANYLLYKQAAEVNCDAQWQACVAECPEGEETEEGIDYGPKIECETACTEDMDTCEYNAGEAVKMYTIIESRLTRCNCENCLLPYCRYFEDSDCANTIQTCNGINQLVTGSPYPSSSTSFIGCNSSAGVAGTLTGIAAGSTNAGNQKNQGGQNTQGNNQDSQGNQNSGQGSQNQNQDNSQSGQQTQTKTQKKDSVVKAGTDVNSLKNSQKAQQVKQKIEQIKEKKQVQKKDFVIKKPDSGKKYELDFEFKTKYYLNKLTDDYIDNIIDDVPVLKYFGTLIKSKKDDMAYQGTEEKTKKNMMDYKTDYYGGKAMNHYDDETEKKLSPAKSFFESVAEKTTAPFAWTFNKLGSFFKSETAKSGSKLYKDFESEVKNNMQRGMDRQTAIGLAKRDFKDTGISNRKYGIYSRATKDKDVGNIIDNVANDLIEDGKI